MATKPELSTNNQGIQNVLVYVSNDNFAQAYAVNQQNVPTSQVIPNGAYHPSSHTMAPLAQKCFPDKVKQPTADYPSYYPVISHNGFPVNYQINQIKNAGPPTGAPSTDKVRDECDYLDSNCVIVGPDGQVRCDSVRSDAAESSCSSLSSADEVNQSQEMVVFDGSGVSVRHGGVVLTVGPNVGPQSAHLGGNNQLSVAVPYGWKRILNNGAIVYISPSNAALGSMEQLREYLLSPGTCKCGLECPLKFEATFSFDPKVVGKPWVLTPDTNTGDLTKLCNHKRKILSMASLGCKPPDPNKIPKDFNIAKRKKRKVAGPYSGVSVSQILAQRDGNSNNKYQKELIGTDQQQVAWAQNRLQGYQPDQQNGQHYLRYQDGQPINRVDGSPIVIDSGIVQQQQNISNPNIQHQQIVSPNGQIISIPSGQVLTQNNLLVQQGSPGHQRIFINGQPTEPTGPGRPGIQMIPVSRQERQQFYAQTPHYGMRPSFVQNNYPPHQIQQLPIQQQQHQQQQQQQQHHQQQQQQHHHQQQQQKLWSKNQSPSPQNIDQRVPPLHQHQPQPNVWHDEVNRKKVKSSKVMKKRPYIIDQQNGRIIEAPCPNIDVRQIPSEGGRVMHFQQNQGTSSPSFLEDPSGYLAQQTALLNTINNTINRQTGANNVTFSCNSPNQAHQAQQPQPIHQQSLPQQNGVPLPSNLAKSSNMTIRPNNVIHVMKQGVQPYQQLVLPPQEVDSSQQECDGSAYQEKVFQRRPDSQPSTPGSLGEDPVTSSTYDKNTSPDSRPIQGGAISTSNHSPQDGSPGPSRDGHFVFRDKEGYFDVQKISGGLVTTMASGRTVGSNTITSVLAGKANTATVSINTAPVTPANNNQVPQITLNVSKTPLEMVQSVVSNIQVPSSQIQGQMSPQIAKSHSFPSGSILVSSGGQLIVANTSNQGSIMAPPPPKLVPNNSMPPISVSPMITNVTAAVSQVIPAVAAQQVLGQQTVLVNALPGPFVLQPGVTMTMDGMTVAPQLLAGNVIHHQQQIQIDNSDPRRGAPVLLSPETKRKGKKRKMPSQTVASMLQNANIVMSPQGFPQQIQMAHSPQNVGAAPVMQALTIVPGKAGQLVMNNQQLIANSQPTQQINLLQPVNLLNGGMVQNFPTIQQFIVPNLGSMVMNPDGTATLLQDNIGMQLQLQNVNGQNVLTPVQNNNVFNGGQNILPAGMVIRTPSGSQGKIIQQQHSPGAQFLSPNGSQFLVNGQLSPLIANVSPSQQVTFNTTPQAIRTANQPTQQEFMMVPVSSSNQNTTFVQQNTTIVQQQTTMVSNNQNFQNNQNQQERPGPPTHQNFLITGDKQQPVQALVFQSSSRQSPQNSLNYRQSVSTQTLVNRNSSSTFCQTSTSTVSSPPDTTTHSPLASGGQSPPTADTTTHTGSTDDGLSPAPSNSSCGDAVTVHNRQQNCSMAMVHCVSSSEPDSVEMGGQNPDLQDWNQRPQQPLHSTPKMEFTDISSLGQGMTQVAKKTNSNPIHMAYAESSTLVSGMHVMSDQMKHDVMNSRAFEKYMQRKRLGETLVVVEGRHELFDGENEVAKTVTEPKNRFIIGDLVWGPAKGCQAWPGKIEQFTNGKVTVRWFGGDKTTTDVDPGCLQTLTEGLDAHHGARKKSRTSRKLNTQLENAIQEAMKELDKKSENPEKKTPGRLRSKIKTEQNNR